MNDKPPELRVRVRDAFNDGPYVEVLDRDGNVLGELSGSIHRDGIAWTAGNHDSIGTLTLKLACERGAVDSVEVAGMNA